MTPPIPQANRGLDFFLSGFSDLGGSLTCRRRLFSPDRIRLAPHSGQRMTFPATAALSISKAAPQQGQSTSFSFRDIAHHLGLTMEINEIIPYPLQVIIATCRLPGKKPNRR